MNDAPVMTLKLVPEKLCAQSVFLCIDDTMTSKSGNKLKDISRLFNYTSLHNDCNHQNGHCFIRLIICDPV